MTTEYVSKNDALLLLSQTLPFSLLQDATRGAITEHSTLAEFAAGAYIFREGEPSNQVLYVIIKGTAKALTATGRVEKVTALRGEGDFFGITVMLSDEPYPLSMQAAEKLTCMLISRDLFKMAMGESQEFADYITAALASRLKDLYQTITADQDYKKMEKQPLRQRIAEIATVNVVTCLPMDNITSIAKKMADQNVSSIVVISLNGKPVGIITEKDLVKKVLSTPHPNLEIKAHQIMSAELITVKPNDFSYQALLLMTRHNIQHVVVTDSNGLLKGIVTIKDLIRTSNSGTLSIVKQIEYQNSLAGLAKVVNDIDLVQQALLAERATASEVCSLINELYERITRKVIRLSEQQMITDGWGAPPIKYCFINMGSAGRKEQFSRSDQDNGIIFEDSLSQAAENAANYFLALGKRIVSGLETCGFKRCSGGVMADNPRWCLPLSRWKENVQGWVNNLEPQNVRNMTIFLDYRFLSGEESLFKELKTYTGGLFRSSPHALLFMAEDDLQQRIPLNFFKQIITEKKGRSHNKLNLKSAVMIHLVDCLRLFALRDGIEETNTFERIRLLNESNIIKDDDAEFIEAAYESLLMFRIKDAFTKMQRGLEPDNLIDLKKLSKKEMVMLKESMLVASRLQSLTAHAFRVYKA